MKTVLAGEGGRHGVRHRLGLDHRRANRRLALPVRGPTGRFIPIAGPTSPVPKKPAIRRWPPASSRSRGVIAVLIAHDKVTVTRPLPPGLPIVGAAVRAVRALMGDRSAGAESWPALGKRIGAAIRDHLDSGVPAVSGTNFGATESELRARVQRVIDDEVNPVIAGHGGGVSILDVRDNVVYLQMWGGLPGLRAGGHDPQARGRGGHPGRRSRGR